MIETRNRLKLATSALATLLFLGAAPAFAGDASIAEAGGTHLGVASCASSTCHGRVTPDEDSPLALNEYFIWSKYDAHAGAYQVLKNEWSQRIAANMGLGDPAQAPECLTCHTDYVAEDKRGERFQLSDGIGCEACHGGAGRWIDAHYGPDASHAENLERGLRPTEEPAVQARLCQSCHVGDSDRFVSHEMMAAGHPRLRFELDTWLNNMPPHHQEDADYDRRKGAVAAADRWAAGIASAARSYLTTLLEHVEGKALTPELGLFDCHACHRPMDTEVRRMARERNLLPAGTVRPNDYALRMLAVIVEPRDATLSDRIRAGNRALHRAAAGSAELFLNRARGLREHVSRAGEVLAQQPLGADERARLREGLLRIAGTGYFRDYADAEQLYLGLQALAAQAGQADSGRYDELFRLLDNERNYAPLRVAAEARRLLDNDSKE